MLSECTYCIVVCALVLERKNLIASPFTSPLKILLGWEEEKLVQVLKGVGGLEVCAYI